MNEKITKTEKIIGLCSEIDRNAEKLYGIFSTLCTEDEELNSFWKHMHEEESEHVEFWGKLKEAYAEGVIPDIYESRNDMVDELEIIVKDSRDMLSIESINCENHQFFSYAYEIEFLLLHPAFIQIFDFVDKINYEGLVNPINNYALHIREFGDMIEKTGMYSRELMVMSKGLLRLFQENLTNAKYSFKDPLTGLLNRRGFYNHMQALANLSSRNGFNVAVMMLDIDYFKKVNDQYGHKTGDDVIRKIAEILENNVRASDVVGRYGGDEYIVFLSNIEDDHLYSLAEKIRIKVNQDSNFNFPVSVSVGASQRKLKGSSLKELEELIKDSDKYLYEAKDFGKNRVCMDYLG